MGADYRGIGELIMSNRVTMGVLTAIAVGLNPVSALAGTPPPVPAVPEPSSLLLFAVGGIAAVAAIRLARRK